MFSQPGHRFRVQLANAVDDLRPEQLAGLLAAQIVERHLFERGLEPVGRLPCLPSDKLVLAGDGADLFGRRRAGQRLALRLGRFERRGELGPLGALPHQDLVEQFLGRDDLETEPTRGG